VLGNDLDIEVNGARPPADQDRRGAAGEVHPRSGLRLLGQSAHEPPDPAGIGYFTHSAARSKLTRRRTSAL
jgi:hypothetical protein